MNIGILTISDRCFKGLRQDKTGVFIKNMIEKQGWKVKIYEIIPDEKEIIKKKLINLVEKQLDLVLTNGGTGLSPRDVTPEATLEIIEKQVPGISEIMRIETYKKTEFSVLSRGICGILKKTLIINLPGSVNGALESLEILVPILSHAIEVMKGNVSDCRDDIKGNAG
ncbi:molybdenum cofactor biosynthesis protein B [candidate division KSB1 bacterium]